MQLAALINLMLTSLIGENYIDAGMFYKIIIISQMFYSFTEDGKKKYLNSYISSHSAWSNKQWWTKTIEWAIDCKL